MIDRECANCGESFDPQESGWDWVCSHSCAVIYYDMTPSDDIEPIEDLEDDN